MAQKGAIAALPDTGSPASDEDRPQPLLTADEWQDKILALRSMYRLRGITGRAQMGWLDPVTVRGFAALRIGSAAPRIERTHSDIRQDPEAYYFALVQQKGQGVVSQDDQIIKVQPGEIVLLNTWRPVSYDALSAHNEWTSVKLPRDELLSHFGKEPQGAMLGRPQSLSSSMLFRLWAGMPDAQASRIDAEEAHLKLVAWDLLAAMFARTDVDGLPGHAQKTLMRALHIIRNRCRESHLSAQEVASEIGVSLRYLQKLFASRGTTCSQAIIDARLDHASRLIERRIAYGGKQTLAEIAYLSGFNDYSYFSRAFMRRFGKRPSVDAR